MAAGVVLLSLTGCGAVTQANSNIAFMGDSITVLWWLPRTNLGIYGNTTGQMLARFPQQVLGHHVRAVVILGGTNDIRKPKIPLDQEIDTAVDNLRAMADLAESENIEVVLCEVPPIRGEDARVIPLNLAIAELAREKQYKLVDYYTPMRGHPEYLRDGLHPSIQGFFVMEQALKKVMPLDY